MGPVLDLLRVIAINAVQHVVTDGTLCTHLNVLGKFYDSLELKVLRQFVGRIIEYL